MNGAIITALNEADTIGWLVSRLKGRGLDVLVIDDGSTDSTGAIAAERGARVIRHHKPQGIGKSLVEGWRYALDEKWERIIQLDAGGSHSPADWRMIDGDIVIGSRFMPGSKYVGRRWRGLLSQIVSLACNWAKHTKITDWTSGYRIYNRRALEILVNTHWLSNGHTWNMEVLGEAIFHKLHIDEFPITYHAGDSKIKLSVIHDLVTVYLWILTH